MKRYLQVLVLIAVTTSALVVIPSPPASACSCAEIGTWTFNGSDGVFTGTVRAIEGSGQEFVATIDVDRDLKDNLDDVISVESFRGDGGNCGWTMEVGDEIASLVRADNGRLSTDGCSIVPQNLLDLWEKPVNRPGVVEAIVGTWGGAIRTIGFDSAGEPIAYGFESGVVHRIGVCDGDEAIVEWVRDGNRRNSRLALRTLSDFVVTAEVPLSTEQGDLHIEEVVCSGDPSAPLLTALAHVEGDSNPTNVVWRYQDQATGWHRVEVDEQPQTRGTRYPDYWPQVSTSRGVIIEAQDSFREVVELPTPTAVNPQTGELPITQLGSGVPFGEAAPTASSDPLGESAAGSSSERQFGLFAIGAAVLLSCTVLALFGVGLRRRSRTY